MFFDIWINTWNYSVNINVSELLFFFSNSDLPGECLLPDISVELWIVNHTVNLI